MSATSGQPVILEIRGLKKAFGGLLAVNNLDLAVRANEILGLIGPNGSGKTTVLNLITGEHSADSGEILLNGSRLNGMRPFQICRKRVSRTFQLVRVMPGMTVMENVMVGRLFGSQPRSMQECRDEVEELLGFVGLSEKRNQLAGQLTYIDQKRVELARALATRPLLLLLDEWLAGLTHAELAAGMALVERVRKLGISVILIEHVMHAVRTLSDRVVVMNAGSKIVEGTPEEVLTHPEVIQAYLGDDDA
ncbi:MAG TPA: ABC transporter ATP-binding protein [Methylomirabilota bacterium]|nr:ABC transporter ATP-binding protein [Methylomirabilota bacterium]